jgi:hypothetical protein
VNPSVAASVALAVSALLLTTQPVFAQELSGIVREA